MSSVHLKLFAGLILVLVLSSCDEDVVRPISEPWPGEFPNRVGDSWVYRVKDSHGVPVDTVTVRIAGRQRLPWPERDSDAAVWEYVHRDGRVDTTYVVATGDTVRIMQGRVQPFGMWVRDGYIFPLEPGRTWGRLSSVYDTTQVVEAGQVRTAAGTFSNAFRLVQSGYALNCIYGAEVWFVPDVGVVSARYTEDDFCYRDETWELSSYSLGN